MHPAKLADQASVNDAADIPEFPGYRIDRNGNVYSCWVGGKHKSGMRPLWAKLLGSPNSAGYPSVKLRRDGRYFPWSVHRLVLLAFVGRCPAGMQACHNDGDRSNPSLSNLRYDTPLANTQDKERHDTQLRGESIPTSKLTASAVREIREATGAHGFQKSLAKRFGVSDATISEIRRRKYWKHVDA